MDLRRSRRNSHAIPMVIGIADLFNLKLEKTIIFIKPKIQSPV